MTNIYAWFQAQPNSWWNSPQQLGSNLGGYQVCAAANADNRLEVFFIDENYYVSHAWQTNSGDFSGVEQFGFQAQQIAVGKNADGRLEFFYIDMNNNLNHCWESSPSNGPWQSEAFGGQARQIALTNDSEGRLQLFYVGMNNYIYTNWQTAPSTNTWDWTVIEEPAQKLAVALGPDGRLQLVITTLWVPGATPIGAELRSYRQAAPAASTWSPSIGLGDLAKDLTFAQHADGSLELFYIGTDDSIRSKKLTNAWQPTDVIGGLAQQLSICRDQDGRLELLYVGMDGYVYHLWQEQVDGGWSGGGGRAGVLASYLSNITDASGQIVVFFLGFLTAPADTVTGLTAAGADNYPLYNNGRPLFNPKVVLTITSELDTGAFTPAQPGQTIHNGFSLQFNASSSKGSTTIWQQYVLEFDGASFWGWINNWKAADLSTENPSITWGWGSVATLSTGADAAGFQVIPAGYQLEVALQTDDSSGTVLGATFAVIDNNGTTVGSTHADLTEAGYQVGDLAPVTAFEVSLVASMDGGRVDFTAGAATLTYSSPAVMTPLAFLPPCVAAGVGTAEQANTNYGSLTDTPQIVTTQTVSIVTSMVEKKALAQRTSENPVRRRVALHPKPVLVA